MSKEIAGNDKETPRHLLAWQELLASESPAQAVRNYLDGFLTQSDECKDLLDKIMTHFKQVSINGEELQMVFESQYKTESLIRLKPPYDKDVEGYPASFMRVIKVHNGISWKAGGGGYFGFGGFEYDEDDDEVRFNGSSFESDCLEEGDKESFLDALDDKGLSIEDVISPMDYGQNWIIWNPLKKNKVKEPELCFVSHEDCAVAPIKKAKDLHFGPFFLRVIYLNIVDYHSEVLDEVYN